MPHAIINDLASRYTAKRYDPTRKISAADLAVIYQALQMSPSSINSQPWKFIVVSSDEAKARLHDTFASQFQFNQPHAKAASQTILFAYNPYYTRTHYGAVVDQQISDGRASPAERDQQFGAFGFVDLNTDENGYNGNWTKAQTYLALGNLMHVLARLGIDSTPMEGVDKTRIGELFAPELNGYVCEVALAIGYHHPDEDYNASLPKSRLPIEQVVSVI